MYGIPYVIYRKIRSLSDVCTKKCGTYELNTARRQHCMIKCKITKIQAELAAAKKNGSAHDLAKLRLKLSKAQIELKKSVHSFKSRGASENN